MSFHGAVIRWITVLILAIGAGAASAGPARADGAPVLLAVQFAPMQGRTEVWVALARPVPFRAEMGATPGRLEITLDAAGVALGATAGRGFGPIRSFHAEAAEPGHTRYVFDLADPVTIAGVQSKPAGRGKPAYAVVMLAPADAMAMTAESGLVFTPDMSAPAPSPAGFAGTLSPEGRGDSSHASEPIAPTGRGKGPPREGLEGEGVQVAAPVQQLAAPTKIVLIAPISTAKPPAIASGKKTIVIDPGHGGIDPGAESVAGYHEKEITLATARALKRSLEETGRYRVVLTRDRDIYLKLYERVKRARAAHGDLMISLHADSIGGGAQPVAERGGARGASIYTLSETASDAESERIAQSENRADAIGGVNLKDESDDVAGILVDLTVRETMNDGNRFAGMLVDSMEQGGIALFRRMPHRSAGFAVLKAPDIPSVLVEMGYLSDIREARGLADPAYQHRIAAAIASAIDRYFAWVEASRS